MNLLLDTHALIRFAEGSSALSRTARTALEDDANLVFYSTASIWEMAIKLALKKLKMTQPLEPAFRELLEENGLEQLGICYQHAAAVASLPRKHGDPFDRLLVVQARLEEMTLVSNDEQLDAYRIHRLW